MSLFYKTGIIGQSKEFLTQAITAFTGVANQIIGTNANGFIDGSLIDPADISNAVDATVATGVTLVAGDFVGFNGSGEVIIADNTAYTTRAQGFVLSGFAAGATATVFKSGNNTGVTVTTGADYFLGTAGSEATAVPAFVDGTIWQVLGSGTPDGLEFEYNPPMEYATTQP